MVISIFILSLLSLRFHNRLVQQQYSCQQHPPAALQYYSKYCKGTLLKCLHTVVCYIYITSATALVHMHLTSCLTHKSQSAYISICVCSCSMPYSHNQLQFSDRASRSVCSVTSLLVPVCYYQLLQLSRSTFELSTWALMPTFSHVTPQNEEVSTCNPFFFFQMIQFLEA